MPRPRRVGDPRILSPAPSKWSGVAALRDHPVTHKGGRMAQPTPSKATRRDFMKVAAGGAAVVAAGPFISRHAEAKPTSITFVRESAYVKNFDEHFIKVLIPAYQKETGIKIDFQIQAAGGSAVPQ